MERYLESDPDVFFQDYKEEIVAKFQEGDNTEFKRIYKHLFQRLTNYVNRFIRSRLDVQDIVADAFCKLLIAHKDMKSYEHLVRWIYRTARNAAIDYLRSQSRQRKGMEAWYYLADYTQDAINSEKQKTYLSKIVNKAIDKLPRQRRTILRLYYFEKQKTHEIAEQMGLRPQTVLNHKTDAIDSLRKTLAFLWE